MPPSGPVLWSSNSSVQLNNSAPQSQDGGGEKMMNGRAEDDVIGSLGKVLSSVNLAGDVDNSAHSSGGQPQGQQYGAPGSGLGSLTGLSGGGPAAPAPAGLSYNFSYNNGGGNAPQAVPPKNGANGSGEHDSIQNILYDSGIYEKEEMMHRRASTGAVPMPNGSRPGTGHNSPLNGSDRERKPSIDMFLSQSPSKALGEDAFRHMMHRTASNPSLAGLGYTSGQSQGSEGGAIGGKPLASTAPSSRSESPRTARPGMSGSGNNGSPSYNANGRPVYHPSQLNATSNNFSPNNGTQVLQQQQGQLLFSGPNDMAGNNQQQQPQQVQLQQPQPQAQQQFMPVQVAQQQPQVFYMAVPAPDGKGQVLQPVQMMQMPGQTGTMMMPVAQGSQPDGNQGMAGGQPMMLMQPVQANNNMGGANSNGGSNNQYPQYGQQGGYDNRYQSKTVDNLVGNQFQQDQGGNMDPTQGGNLSTLYASPQRPPLRSLLGNVRRLSRDQVGCRLLQQALDEDGPSAATAILNEGLTFWAEAMVDPFGNYLFQKILERITPEERVTLVSSVSTRLVNASLNLHGTRSVQKIVEVCAADEEEEDSDEEGEKEEENKKEGDDDKGKKKGKKKKDTAAKILTDALKPSAARLCIDSHGNHAIQRILLKLPYRYTQFIFDAVAASVEDVARHRHGCCVIQRCLDSRHSIARTHLVARIVEKSLELMQDAYGNYVVQYVLDVCGDDEVHAICESVVGRVCPLAVQKFSSNVMEKCLERCTDRVREEYLNELNDSDRIRELMMDPFGNYVVQRALSVSTHAQAIRLVETMKPHLSAQSGGGIRNTAGGRRILGKICRRFPNFALEGETFDDYDLNSILARGAHQNPHGGGGGGRRGQGYGGYQHSGQSPNHRRNGRGRGGYHQQGQHQGHTIVGYGQPQPQGQIYQQVQPQQQQVIGHHISVQQPDMNVMQYGGNAYLYPHSM